MAKKLVFTIIIISLILPGIIFASEDDKGTTGNAFMKVTPGARQIGMGEAFTGLSDDVYALDYNIAGLAFRNYRGVSYRKLELSAAGNEWLDDTYQAHLSGVSPLPIYIGYAGTEHILGLSATYFDEGTINERDVNGLETGRSFKSYDAILKLGYALRYRSFSIGLGGQYVHTDLAEQETSDSYSMHAGAMALFNINNSEFRIGVSGRNLVGNKVKFIEDEFDQNRSLHGGASGNFKFSDRFRWIVSGEVVKPDDNDMLMRAGTELILKMENFALMPRLGYKDKADIEGVGTEGLSIGLGISYDNWQFDYAYMPMDNLDESTNRFSLTFRFIEEKARELGRPPFEERTEPVFSPPTPITETAPQSEIEIMELPEGAGIRVRLHINFDFDKSEIRPESVPILEKAYNAIEQYPNSMIQLEGHTDEIGTEKYNIGLSYRRVNSVLEYLRDKKGISKDRFYEPVGYGETRPIAPNTTAEGRFKNRRVEIIVYKPEFAPPKERADGLADVSIKPGGGGSAVVVLSFDGNAVPDKEFILPNPSRLVIDVGNVTAKMGKKTFPANLGNLKQIRVAPHEEGNFTRIVLDLFSNITEADYTLTTLGNKITILVK